MSLKDFWMNCWYRLTEGSFVYIDFIKHYYLMSLFWLHQTWCSLVHKLYILSSTRLTQASGRLRPSMMWKSYFPWRNRILKSRPKQNRRERTRVWKCLWNLFLWKWTSCLPKISNADMDPIHQTVCRNSTTPKHCCSSWAVFVCCKVRTVFYVAR